MNEIDTELRKVKAATTLCHLCTLEQLEKWVVEIKEKSDENKNNQSDTDHA